MSVCAIKVSDLYLLLTFSPVTMHPFVLSPTFTSILRNKRPRFVVGSLQVGFLNEPVEGLALNNSTNLEVNVTTDPLQYRLYLITRDPSE